MKTLRRPEADASLGRRRGVRLSIEHTLTFGFPLLFLVSLGASLWFAFDAAWRNTRDLERDLAELTVEAAIREVDTHLGAAQEQVEFIASIIERGDVHIADERRLTDLMAGALAAAPQVSGLALVRSDYSVLRVGLRGDELITRGGSWAVRQTPRPVGGYWMEKGTFSLAPKQNVPFCRLTHSASHFRNLRKDGRHFCWGCSAAPGIGPGLVRIS